jgi:hypothetical protein
MNLFDVALLKRFLLAGLRDPVAWVVLGFVALVVTVTIVAVRRFARGSDADRAAREAVSRLGFTFLRSFCCEPWRAARLIDVAACAEQIEESPDRFRFGALATSTRGPPRGRRRGQRAMGGAEIQVPAGEVVADGEAGGKGPVSPSSRIDPDTLHKAILSMRPHCTLRHFDHALAERLNSSVEFFGHLDGKNNSRVRRHG